MKTELNKRIALWRRDPLSFIREVLRNPETGKRFELYPAEAEFIRRAFTLTKDGRLPYPEMLFSAPKKSGKTCLAAMCAIYVAVVLGGAYGEVYCLSNDFEQSQGRVFQAAVRIIEASPLLAKAAKVTTSRIEFSSPARLSWQWLMTIRASPVPIPICASSTNSGATPAKRRGGCGTRQCRGRLAKSLVG